MDKSIIELAIRGLETEKQKIDAAIVELRNQLNGAAPRNANARSSASEDTPNTRSRKRTMSAEARKKISEAQKARWAKKK